MQMITGSAVQNLRMWAITVHGLRHKLKSNASSFVMGCSTYGLLSQCLVFQMSTGM